MGSERNGNGNAVAVNNMEMEERREPALIKFTEGECVEGMLLSIDRVQVGDPHRPDAPKKPVTKFTLDVGNGERASFLGSYDLVSKIRLEDRGHFVSVRYEGEDKTVSRNGNSLKRFKVLVSKGPVRTGEALAADPGITDEDIPF
jgi:hypothetical protein